MTMGDEEFSEVAVTGASAKESGGNSRTWIAGLFLGAGLGIGLTFTSMVLLSPLLARPQNSGENKAAKSGKPVMTVTVLPVTDAQVDLTINTTGTIAARELIPILPLVNGLQIKKIPDDVKEGSFIQKGQVLAILDDSILQTQINQAKADVTSNRADVESKQADVISKQADVAATQAIVQQRRADLSQAQARLEEAQKYFHRYQKLAIAGAISHQDLDTRYYTLKTALDAVHLGQENVRSALANVKSSQANIGSVKALVNKSESIVHSSAAKVQQLTTQLGQTVVRSPVSGIIAEKLAKIGDVPSSVPGQSGSTGGGAQKLFSIIQDGKLELQGQLPQIQLGQVKVGAIVQITSALDQKIHLQGRVREIQPLVNDKSREATVKIDLPPTKLLKVGMFAQGKIVTGTAQGMVLPQKAVRSQADGSYIVFTLKGEDANPDQKVNIKQVSAQVVEVGELIPGDKITIKSGLHLGDRVVLDGAGYLKNSDYVQVVNK
jgi:RND family efflux transporter MFP subunit